VVGVPLMEGVKDREYGRETETVGVGVDETLGSADPGDSLND